MDKKELKQKLEDYANGVEKDIKTKSLVALLSACEAEELSGAILNLTNKLPIMISSNTTLSKSNEQCSNSMNWLTLALVIVGIVGIIISIVK